MIGFVFIGLVLMSLFVGVVSAESILDKLLGDNIGSINLNLENLQRSTGFAQFLLFILVALIVFAVSGSMPFVKDNKYVQAGLAIIVGILATFYLKSTEIATILISYSALGITLTGIIPFIIIAVISKKLHEDEYGFFSKFVWIVFGVVTVVRYLSADTTEIGSFGQLVYPLVLLATLGMIFFESKLWRRVRQGANKRLRERFIERQVNTRLAERERSRAVTDAQKDNPNIMRGEE